MSRQTLKNPTRRATIIRLEPDLWKKIKAEAVREHRSLCEQAVFYIELGMNQPTNPK